MAPRNTPRTWNDVQTAIATVAIVTTLGLWNLFAKPQPQQTVEADPTLSPTEEPPADLPPTPLPQVKIFFTPQDTPQTSVQSAPQTTSVAQQSKVKKKNKTKSGGTVTRTKTS